MIDKKDILKKRIETEYKDFESETLGGTVRFKRMNAAGSYAVDGNKIIVNEDGTHTLNLAHVRQAMIAYSMVDGNNKLIWNERDIRGAISELEKDVIDELAGFAFEMNPQLLPDSEAKKNLEKNPEGSLSTE